MPTTSLFPRNVYGNPLRPFQLVSNDTFFGAPSPSFTTPDLHKLGKLGGSVYHFLRKIKVCLPPGCPFILGGGIVRDGLLGAEPRDIDVWLPSNILHTNPEDFYPEGTVVFNGPQAINQENLDDYRDVSNHWVIETEFRGYSFNFMRSMVEWTTPQEFFNRLMRNFDIDLCMMFVAFDSSNLQLPKHIIMPKHILDQINTQSEVRKFCWNTQRFETTSYPRIESRSDKMHNKYDLSRPCGFIDRGMIEAVPVPISYLHENLHLLPYPRVTT